MNLILTMAGEYNRFKSEGYKIPKFLLPWGHKTILSEILHEMSPHFSDVYLIMNTKDKEYGVHVKQILLNYGIDPNNLVYISSTQSQTETLYEGLKLLGPLVGNLVIHNIDTILYNRDYPHIQDCLSISDGFIDTFISNNPEYSYVLYEKNQIQSIVEKILISNTASSGMYGFSSVDIFLKFYQKGYFSKIYESMIKNNILVSTTSPYTESNTIVLGTPKEYNNLSKIKLV